MKAVARCYYRPSPSPPEEMLVVPEGLGVAVTEPLRGEWVLLLVGVCGGCFRGVALLVFGRACIRLKEVGITARWGNKPHTPPTLSGFPAAGPREPLREVWRKMLVESGLVGLARRVGGRFGALGRARPGSGRGNGGGLWGRWGAF